MKRKKTNWIVVISFSLILSMTLQLSAQDYTGAAEPYQKEQVQKPMKDYSYKYVLSGERQGGEDISSAVPIQGGLPYNDAGNTCSNADDYDEACPYTGSTSPDVVYSYTPATDVVVDIDLFGSAYDTKVYVYENAATPGSPYACNDDFYFDFVSKIEGLFLSAGNTYYIIVDGYGTDCGDYTLTITEFVPCVVECLPCATDEGEPDILDDEEDIVNGGCNSNPTVFSPITLGEVYCGRGNIYNYFGSTYRDTDWYEIVLTQTTDLYWTVVAEFPIYVVILNGSCPLGSDIVSGTGNGCEEVQVHANLPAGTYYLFVGSTDFTVGVEGDYLAVASDGPPTDPWCSSQIPVSNWAIYFGIFLIGLFVIFRFRRRLA